MAEPARSQSAPRPSGQHQVALNLDSARLRAMNEARLSSASTDMPANDNGMGDGGVQGSEMGNTSLDQSGGSRSVLDLPPQSYTKREETEMDRASEIQRKMREAQERFTTPGGVSKQEGGGGALEEGFSERMQAVERGGQEQDQMEMYRQIEEQKAKAMIAAMSQVAGAVGGAAGKGVGEAMEFTEKMFGARALLAIGAKAAMFSAGFAIFPLLLLIVYVNLEVLHLFFPIIHLSPEAETRWMIKGLDLSAGKKGMYKLLTILVALLVNLGILVLILFIALIIFAIIYICNMTWLDVVGLVTGQ